MTTPFDQHSLSTYPVHQADAGAATLHAVFIADERPAHLGLYTGARCELPTGVSESTAGVQAA